MVQSMCRNFLGALFAILFASPLAAAPCTNNNWQPTFVHDLDNEDGPWYVTDQMGFMRLRWVANGGYVPHACELAPSVQFTRNPRGYTNCQQYTRVQCGCSRFIPGNDTCAAFLAFHSAAVVPPAQPAGSSINVPGSQFTPAPQYSGAVQVLGNAVVLNGGAWTNGRLQNGFYDGNRVFSAETFDFSQGGDAYMQLVVNGAGQYMGFWPRVLKGVGIPHMSTHHSWANSVVVEDNETLFAHVRVEPGGAYTIRIARGAYDDNGGQIVLQGSGILANPRARLDLQFGDNYAGTAASITIAEAMVRTGGPAASNPPPLQPAAQPPSTGLRGNLPGGAACSSETDCASSICLLGVCAPAQ